MPIAAGPPVARCFPRSPGRLTFHLPTVFETLPGPSPCAKPVQAKRRALPLPKTVGRWGGQSIAIAQPRGGSGPHAETGSLRDESRGFWGRRGTQKAAPCETPSLQLPAGEKGQAEWWDWNRRWK
jgi:hypothetical protein